MLHSIPVTTGNSLILNIVGDTQEAARPMLILLLFYLSNRLVFFRALNREREKKVGRETGMR